MLVVRDNGQGIPSAVLSRMKAGRAAGIGLAGMSERISDLGGSLLVESHSGGTAIRATLSFEPQAQENPSDSAAVSSSATSSRSA
jgi:two-component system NarL family sensor kinase